MASRSKKVDKKTPLNDWNSSFERKLEESNRAIKKKFLLHRLIVIASLPQQLADRSNLGVHYEKLNQRLKKYNDGDGITGLLVLYPTCMLHVIESSNEVLVSLLQDMRHMQQQPDCALIQAPKILVMSHDVPSRLFQQWGYKVQDVQAKPLGAEQEDTETLVGIVLSLLMKQGIHHQNAANKGSKTSPGSVLDEVPELIVPQDVLAQLLCRKELLCPQQYLKAYYSPLNVTMDFDPPPRPRFPGFCFENYSLVPAIHLWETKLLVIVSCVY